MTTNSKVVKRTRPPPEVGPKDAGFHPELVLQAHECLGSSVVAISDDQSSFFKPRFRRQLAVADFIIMLIFTIAPSLPTKTRLLNLARSMIAAIWATCFWSGFARYAPRASVRPVGHARSWLASAVHVAGRRSNRALRLIENKTTGRDPWRSGSHKGNRDVRLKGARARSNR
jgi:hypothetical protein